jgi:hypothetical protein
MRETAAELATMQRLLDASYAGGSGQLREIIDDRRRLTAGQISAALDGMKVLVVATTTAHCEPRTSCVDGHFLHGRWLFSTSGGAIKAKHLKVRPAISATHVDGERLAVFTHGTVECVTAEHPDFAGYDAYFADHYGSAASSWGPDIVFFRLNPTWMIGYSMDAASIPSVTGGADA